MLNSPRVMEASSDLAGGGDPPGGRPTTPPRKDLLTTMSELEPEPLPGLLGLAETTVRRTWVGMASSWRAYMYTNARCPLAANWMVELNNSQDNDGNDNDGNDNNDNNALSLSGLPPPSGCVLSMVRSRWKVEMASVLPPSPVADAMLDAAARTERTTRMAARPERRTLWLSLQQGLRALCQDLPHRLGRRWQPSWRGHQPCTPSFLKTLLNFFVEKEKMGCANDEPLGKGNNHSKAPIKAPHNKTMESRSPAV
jgi:hypothetical protein